MSPAATPADIEALDAQAQRLMAAFARAGYERVAPAVIQPAGLFLDVVGEALRARTYVFTDPDGAELCLRPDLTVPTCRLHLERHADRQRRPRATATRARPSAISRRAPTAPTRASSARPASSPSPRPIARRMTRPCCALIVAALREAGLDGLKLRLGDLGLFTALIDALPMPERWRRRLEHQFWRPEAFRAELQRLTSGAARTDLPAALLDRLDPADAAGAEALVLEHLDQAGHELIGTRTAAEIAQRLLAEAADRREQPLPAATAALIESYVAVKAPARAAVDKLAQLARENRIDLSAGLDAFRRRLDLIAAAGVPIADAEFSAEFGRNLEYYTGFVFEIIAPALGPKSPVAGGGRYDSLLAEVGAPQRGAGRRRLHPHRAPARRAAGGRAMTAARPSSSSRCPPRAA